jgi:soluble lytic murein transglycosylase-like protein
MIEMDKLIGALDPMSMPEAFNDTLPPIPAVLPPIESIKGPMLNAVPIELQFRKYIWTENPLLQFNQPSTVAKENITSTEELKSLQYDRIIHEVSDRYQIDPALIKAMIRVESRYNHRAQSHRGAQGLMQLMPRTAAELGVTDILDPEQNIDAGARYYKWLLKRVKGQRDLALAAYNAGIKRVLQYRGIPPFSETRAYVLKVMRYYDKYKDSSEQS